MRTEAARARWRRYYYRNWEKLTAQTRERKRLQKLGLWTKKPKYKKYDDGLTAQKRYRIRHADRVAEAKKDWARRKKAGEVMVPCIDPIHIRGEKAAFATLNTEKVLAIRHEYRTNPNCNFAEIGRRLGVGKGCVRDAAIGKSWRHLP